MPNSDNETYFGTLSPAQTSRAEVMLLALAVRYRLDRMIGVDKDILAAWLAEDESSASGDAVDLWICSEDLGKLGGAFVKLFPERRFDN